jgi:hypothetical protein
MGKGSGVCDRPGISLEASDSAEIESTLSGAEINTTLKLQRFGKQWFTKDYMVTFQKRKEGWTSFSYSEPIRQAFKEYGLIYQQAGTSSYELTYFPTLQEAQQAVSDVSLEAGLSIDSRLTRGASISYKIGNLPLIIKRNGNHWRVYAPSDEGPAYLENHFDSVEEFVAAWESADSALAHYLTRSSAHQAVINWLAQIIAEEE